MLKRSAVSAINHLLAQQPALQERLASFAGECAEFRLDPLPTLRLMILGSGGVAQASPEQTGSLVVTLRRAALPLLLRRDATALGEIEIAGNEGLADAVRFVLMHIEWDPEEDLSRLVGDVLAHRIAGVGRDFVAWQRDAGYRLAQNFAEYWTEERPVLARADDFATFSAEVSALNEATAQLEGRLDVLVQPAITGSQGS
ncbi:MAG: hypothetical protein EXR27_12730 [Betaproteobacteria bacterium]|nr:hypothetical protein [Betaproteobacteria bacterium]